MKEICLTQLFAVVPETFQTNYGIHQKFRTFHIMFSPINCFRPSNQYLSLLYESLMKSKAPAGTLSEYLFM